MNKSIGLNEDNVQLFYVLHA